MSAEKKKAKNPLVTVEPIADGPGSFDFWKEQATRAAEWWTELATHRKWDENLQSVIVKPLKKAPAQDTVVVPKDFTLSEQKTSLLFFQVPEVSLTALQPGLEQAVSTFQAVINRMLMPDQVNAAAMMSEVLADMIVPAGVGVSQIGYEVTVDSQTPQIPAVDPATGGPIPATDESGQPILDEMGQPTPLMQPNIVREKYTWNRIPIKDVLIPPTFHGSDWDQAPWLGRKIRLDRAVAERVYGLKDPRTASRADEESARLSSDIPPAEGTAAPEVHGFEVWYRASRVRKDVANDDCIYQLIWFDGEDGPSVHRESPYQKVEGGKIVGGMIGYPIHAWTLRYVSDQAVPPSDCSITRGLGDELTAGRSAMITQRKRSKSVLAADPRRMSQTQVDAWERGEIGSMIFIDGFSAADSPIGEVARANYPRENFEFNNIIDRDYNSAWAISDNQQGQQTAGKRTATELSLVAQATQTRMERERVSVARTFVAGVAKLAALIQLFADDEDYVQLVGPDGVKKLQPWDKHAIQGRFLFTAKPDSTQRLDSQFERKEALDTYSFFRKDPLVNPNYLLQQTARRMGLDETQFIAPQQPPEPEKPKVSLALKGEDLDPGSAQYPAIHALLTQAGMAQGLPVPNPLLSAFDSAANRQEEAAANAPPPEHGGMASKARPLSQQNSERTGKLPGGGLAGSVQ